MSNHSTLQRRQDAGTSENSMPEAGARSFAPPAMQLVADNSASQGQVVQRNEISEEVTDDVMTHLNHREGRRNDVYIDSEGFPTAGVGHLMSRGDLARYPVGSIVPDAQINEWLAADSTDAYQAAVQQAVEIKYENQLLVDILTSVNFQSGTRWYEEHANTWRKLKAQQWEAAALEVGDSQWFEQTPVRITDFQRVLLAIAGKPNDYDSVRAFNASNITKWGVVFPTRSSFNAYHFNGASAGQGGETEGGQTEGGQTTGGETTGGETQGNTGGLSGAVGISSSGEFIGSNSDAMKVQQLLINAGLLPATRVNQAGETVSNADGYIGEATVAAIRAFQASEVGMAKPDGRIDVGGGTWSALAAYEGQTAEAETPVTESPSTEAPTEETVTPVSGETEAPATEAEAPVTAVPSVSGDIGGPVGLSPDGSSYVGSRDDVMKVQQLLVNNGLIPATRVNQAGDTVTNVDGYMGDVTVNAIIAFQRDVLGFQSTDGRVDPGGKTWDGLTGQTGSGFQDGEQEEQSSEPVVEETTGPETDTGNVDAGNSDMEGGQTQSPTGGLGAGPEGFDSVPENYRNQFIIGRRVGGNPNYVANPAAQDRARIEIMLRMMGYSLNPTASNRQGATWKRRQLANCIANFQARVPGLSRDAVVDPNGNTWKAMVVAAYTLSGGQPMSQGQMSANLSARRGTTADVPSDLKSKCGGGHLVGIDKSGYMLPQELQTNGRNLASALDTIVDEIGNFSISNAYRSPEHNVKIGSTASASQHVIGYAADIQHSNPGWLKRTLLRLMRDGTIPPGGVGQYGWGVHYDLRGTITDFQ